MNIIKKITLISLLSLFAMNTAYAACDCSNPKGFHCKMSCKIKGETADPAKQGDGFFKKFKLPGLGELGGKPVDNS
tara:strand:- start:3464 stop:3691 length:228 start_codon:yes stop_codon:yes gene_type:complete